jgi:hypothetical protein
MKSVRGGTPLKKTEAEGLLNERLTAPLGLSTEDDSGFGFVISSRLNPQKAG